MTSTTPSVTLRYADLLASVSDDDPCGPDLEYDPAFVMLQTAVAPRYDAQYGDFVDVPQPANWAEIERDCRALLLRTKDLRVAMILLRCRTRQGGAEGWRDGLAFVMGLIEQYGEALHPVPTFEGARDPVMYANAIGALADPEGALGDARDIPITKTAGVQLYLRDIERAFATPRVKDALAPESAVRLLSELWGRRETPMVALSEAQRLTAELIAWCSQHLGADAPDLGALLRLLQPFAQAQIERNGPAARAASPMVTPAAVPSAGTTTTDAPASTAPDTHAATPTPPIAPDTPASDVIHEPARMDRWSALATIREVRIWFEQNEPSSPVVVLLRQSERMVGKRFSELAQVIPAELLAVWDSIDT